MAEIITNENWVELDGARLQKGSRDLYFIPGGVSLRVAGSSSKIDVLAEGSTIDGVAVTDRDELMAFFEAQGFNNGGGDGDGVTQEELDGRVPVLGLNNFLVGGEDGNDQRSIVGADLGVTQTSNNWYVPRWNPTAQEWGGTAQLVSPNPNTSVIRTSAGQGKFGAAAAADDAVVLSQFSGIVNDTLTDSETSTTLNTAYPDVTVGFTVTTVTGLSEYRKISATDWVKKTIESI